MGDTMEPSFRFETGPFETYSEVRSEGEDQRVPALRAQKLGLGWWGPLIDTYRRQPGQAAVCVPPVAAPPNAPFTPPPASRDNLPIIAFRKSLAPDLARLGQELRAGRIGSLHHGV